MSRVTKSTKIRFQSDDLSLLFPSVVKVDSLTPDSKGDNLLVQVVELKVILERTNLDGSTTRIAEALVGDETGTILLTARNGQTMEGDERQRQTEE